MTTTDASAVPTVPTLPDAPLTVPVCPTCAGTAGARARWSGQEDSRPCVVCGEDTWRSLPQYEADAARVRLGGIEAWQRRVSERQASLAEARRNWYREPLVTHLAQGLRVLRDRGVQLSEEQILERARNMADGLLGEFSVYQIEASK